MGEKGKEEKKGGHILRMMHKFPKRCAGKEEGYEEKRQGEEGFFIQDSDPDLMKPISFNFLGLSEKSCNYSLLSGSGCYFLPIEALQLFLALKLVKKFTAGLFYLFNIFKFRINHFPMLIK